MSVSARQVQADVDQLTRELDAEHNNVSQDDGELRIEHRWGEGSDRIPAVQGISTDFLPHIVIEGRARRGLYNVDLDVLEGIRMEGYDKGYAIADSVIDTIEGPVINNTNEGDAIVDSTVGRVKGDIKADYSALKDSFVDRVAGDLEGQKVLNNTDGALVRGDVSTGDDFADSILRNADMPVILSESVDGSSIDSFDWDILESSSGKTFLQSSYGGIIAAEEFSVAETTQHTFLLAENDRQQFHRDDSEPEPNRFMDDIEELQQQIWRQPEEFLGLMLLPPENDGSRYNMRDIREMESERRELVEDTLGKPEQVYDDVRRNVGYVSDFRPFLDDRELLEMLDSATSEMERMKKERVGDFAEVMHKMDREDAEELVHRLREAEESAGKDLFNIGKGREYLFFIEDEEEAIQDLLRGKSERPEIDGFLRTEGGWAESEWYDGYTDYAGVLEKLYSEDDIEDELRHLSHLADQLDIELGIDVGKKLKKWEYQRREQGRTVQPDMERLRSELESEIASKKRDWTIQAIQEMGRKHAVDEYEDATGERKEEFDSWELEYLKARSRTSSPDRLEAFDKVLEHGEEIYSLRENTRWLEEKGLSEDTITSGPGKLSRDLEQEDMTGGVEDTRENILSEMQRLLDEYNQLMGENYTAETVDDFLELKQVVDEPDEDPDGIYQELFREKPNELQGIEGQVHGLPDSLEIGIGSVAETADMGNAFTNSCLAVGKSNDWGIAQVAADANKQPVYAYDDDGNIVGRTLATITEDDTLTRYSIYSNINADLESYFDEYLEAWAEELDRDAEIDIDYERPAGQSQEDFNKNVALLEAEDWYNGGL
ncbi:MAG: hypothetical protein ABEJ64_02820 [Candidatus Nanohaloarchaea archaeon]